MTESDSDQYSEVVTLKTVVQNEGFQFPILVRINENDEDYEIFDPDNNEQLPPGSLLMLDSQVNIRYTHVRVLNLEDRESVRKAKGEQYVSDHDVLVNKEFLIPQNLHCMVKIASNPTIAYKKNRYITVDEVVNNPPRYVRVGPGTMCYIPEKNKSKPVPANTRLEVKKVQHQSKDMTLVCTDCKAKQFIFKHDSKINFTAVDVEDYCLAEISPSVMLLPKTIKFMNDICPDDVVLYNDELAQNALLMTVGLLEVVGIHRRPVLVGYLRVKDCTSGIKTFKQVLIPIALWQKELVQMRLFNDVHEKAMYCQRKFPVSTGEEAYQNKLYIVPYELQRTYVSYLMTNPSTDAGDQDDDSSDNYEKPISSTAPTLPPRPKPKVPNKNTKPPKVVQIVPEETIALPMKRVNPDILTRIKERTKLGFGHVHKELVYVFNIKRTVNNRQTSKKSQNKDIPTTNDASQPEVTSSVSESKKPAPKVKPNPVVKRSPTAKPKPTVHTISQRSDDQTDSKPPLPDRSKKPNIKPNNDYINTNKMAMSDSTSEASSIYKHPPSLPISAKRILPDLPVSDDDEDFEYDYPEIRDFTKPTSVPAYAKLTVAEKQTLTKKNQTVKDFCHYSVNQVSECFRICGLEKLGDVCLENMVDGAFLASFDFDLLRKAPFHLTDFQLNKVKLVIQNGWRPKFDET